MTRTPREARAFLKELFTTRFGEARGGAPVLTSAPGRVELAGNHTDHQGGRTLSAAIDRRVWALAAANGTREIRACMDGFGQAVVRLDDLGPHAHERGTSASLVRGMAAAYAEAGGTLRGFDMVTCSDVPAGCGLSSSAAFEMAVGTAIRAVCDGPGTPPRSRTAMALEGARAERDWFGKPCGAQDQLASAHGGIVALDFAAEEPRVSPVAFDAGRCGWATCLVDSRCDHSHHIEEYAAVPADMRSVARRFGHERLEDVSYGKFLAQLADVRGQLGDRAALRALHYFEETRRVAVQQQALEAGDFAAFLELVRQSGASSAQFLQNVSPRADGTGARQSAMVVLALCAHLLDGAGADGAQSANASGSGSGSAPADADAGRATSASAPSLRGAYRIHGGGFGGSVLAFVPRARLDAFTAEMDALLGYDACLRVEIGARGACVEEPA